MSFAKTRRHYRTAHKQDDCCTMNGIYVSRGQLRKIMCASAIIGLVIYLKGFFMGIMVHKCGEQGTYR